MIGLYPKGGSKMNQIKIGAFLKELRKEKNITQEKLAEEFGVSGRTVSRWETGSNMPDLDLLILIADFYGVEIREILDGERKSGEMNKELEETVLKVADYSNAEKEKFTGRLHILLLIGILTFVVWAVLEFSGLAAAEIYDNIGSACLGFSFGMLILGAIFTGRYSVKIRQFKKRLLHIKKEG